MKSKTKKASVTKFKVQTPKKEETKKEGIVLDATKKVEVVKKDQEKIQEKATITVDKKVQVIKKVPMPVAKKPANIPDPNKPKIPQPQQKPQQQAQQKPQQQMQQKPQAQLKPQAQHAQIQKPQKCHIQLIKQADKDKKVVAVILTFHWQASYDHLFTHVQQKAQQGTQVLVYACSSYDAKIILEGLKKQSEIPVVKEMIQHIGTVDPDCVVFNWECCSHYGDKKFNEGKATVFQLLEIVIQKGYMAMFSDFSLKALIAQWDEKSLGPNPFVSCGEHSSNFTLNFNCQTLKNCPSAQLQIIGDMASEGHCNVAAMASTIVYGVDKSKTEHDIYKLQVLTVATGVAISAHKQLYQCQINDKKGAAGHVALTYKSGGCLLTSMGHWIQLMKVDTSEQVLFQVAAREFGEEKVKSMKMEYEKLDVESKRAYISKNAVEFVQSQAPCKNMSKKAKKMF